MPITFHPLGEKDLTTMHQWLNDPEVVQWWEGDDVTWAGVVTDYSPEREPDGVASAIVQTAPAVLARK